MPQSEADPSIPSRRRERSARYPGATLFDAIELVREMGQRGVDGLPSASVAAAMGYKNIKTQTFSARLSAARQYGLITLRDGCYSLTELARSILHPLDPGRVPALHRLAFLQPALNAELCEKLEGRRVPDMPALANWLYHHHQITASAIDAAAEIFLTSARELGVLGEDGILRTGGVSLPDSTADAGMGQDSSEASTARQVTRLPASKPVQVPPAKPVVAVISQAPVEPRVTVAPPVERPVPENSVSYDLPLWGQDEGKQIRVIAPQSISRSSLERFLQSFQLMVRVEDD